VRPNEETLKKLNSNGSSIHNYLHQKQQTQQNQMKSNFQAFPNGGNQSFEDSAQSDVTGVDIKSSKENRTKSAGVAHLGSKSNKQLPAINRLTSANKPTSAKSIAISKSK
jgi:hypothetical protein